MPRRYLVLTLLKYRALPFVESLSQCPKHGLHNPFKSPERYLLYGDISTKAAHMLALPKVSDFFTRLIQRVAPKSYQQAAGEVFVTQKFLAVIRCGSWQGLLQCLVIIMVSKVMATAGLMVTIITPFNFPLEIPLLQLMGALYMGNKPLLKVDSKVSIVMEQMMRLLHYCGLPVEDVDFINSDGKTMNKILLENWAKTSLVSKLKDLAGRRKLEDFTIGPVLTFTTEAMLEHMENLLQIQGSKLLFGGKRLKNHSIPSVYGALEPTAVYVPIEEILKDSKNYELVTKEIFGPFQIVTEYKKDQLPLVLDALERMHAHLTAAEVIGNSVNGTTYAGLRGRTTGAPQNHWFGPAGDPRGAGIGTPEAIKLVWSCHREIIYDYGPIPHGWELPPST
ncbi:hypothetical protein Bca4012_053086 [Brassica carinata]